MKVSRKKNSKNENKNNYSLLNVLVLWTLRVVMGSLLLKFIAYHTAFQSYKNRVKGTEINN